MAHTARKCASFILVLILVIAMAAPAALADSYSVHINKATKVYQKKSTSSKSLSVKKGTKCTLTNLSGSWATIKRDGVTAYIPTKYITLNERIKNYTNRDTKVYAKASTSSKATKVDVNTEVYIVGREGDFWRVETKNGKVTAYVKCSHTDDNKVAVKAPEKEPVKAPAKDDWKSKVVKMDWFDGGSKVLSRGEYAYIYDTATGIKLKIKRMGGINHADIEPATAEDTEKLLKIAGGKFSWNSESVILMVDGKYIACAINTMPHGRQTIDDNNYEGQCCLHMVGSLTHGSESVNSSHQKAIDKAYNWAH